MKAAGVELLKMLVTGMGAMLVTGGTAWMVFGNDKVTRTDMVEYVATNSPWARDKGVVELELKRNHETLERLQELVEALSKTQHDLAAEQRILLERISRAVGGK